MSQWKEVDRFDADLKGSMALREKMDEVCKRIAKEGKAQSDGEVLVAAARELGYEFTITELEQYKAGKETLDNEALESVSGGIVIHEEVCDHDYVCDMVYGAEREDEHGHNDWCVTAWHCFVVTLHTESNEDRIACWSNYNCGIAWKH